MTPDVEAKSLVSGALSPISRASFSGIDADVLLGGDKAPFTVMDMTVAPGTGAPAHISFHEEKVFHVAEGAFLFLVGEDRITVEPGQHVYVAQGVTHGFSALGASPARMTLVSTPAHHERFFKALSDLSVPHDPQEVAAVCAAFDQAIVGPVITPQDASP
ncbi:cupin domain-containing protein [uncultured Roseibium sp.]|uniref:cupin domain-containing protein n=1 Tax=uncultured Roseibium sp. TaxID=1936171 RepID=UPI0032178E8D